VGDRWPEGPLGRDHRRRAAARDVSAEGGAWIEAANPERPFLEDVQRGAQLDLERGGDVHHCRATIVPNPEGHARIRELLASRYGWADCWIGLIADTRRSVALRLACG
jgi:hypothetical protein